MNTLPITMTNPADSHNNHSACAGKKGPTFALLATMLHGCFRESMELRS